MRFVCDRMLGSLARWMRLFGFDVLYPNEMDDTELLALALTEGRILLTRDKVLSSSSENVLYIESGRWDLQYGQISNHFGLKIETPMTRCSVCNEAIIGISKNEVKDRVPEKVYELQEEFWHCRKCDKYYWKGTHWEGIMERVASLEGSP